MSMNNIPQSTTLSNTTAGTSCFDANHIDVTTIEDLEQVGSDKWTRYPGCIGAFIAEMDYETRQSRHLMDTAKPRVHIRQPRLMGHRHH